MADNQNMIVEEPKKKLTWAGFKAGFKEWGRKQIVNLKRRPTNIAFFVLIITSLVYLIGYSSVAQFLYSQQINTSVVRWSGLCFAGKAKPSNLETAPRASRFFKCAAHAKNFQGEERR